MTGSQLAVDDFRRPISCRCLLLSRSKPRPWEFPVQPTIPLSRILQQTYQSHHGSNAERHQDRPARLQGHESARSHYQSTQPPIRSGLPRSGGRCPAASPLHVCVRAEGGSTRQELSGILAVPAARPLLTLSRRSSDAKVDMIWLLRWIMDSLPELGSLSGVRFPGCVVVPHFSER